MCWPRTCSSPRLTPRCAASPFLRAQDHPVGYGGLHLGPAHPTRRRLPRHLEEVLEADLILHVRDIAHPETANRPPTWPTSCNRWASAPPHRCMSLEQTRPRRPLGTRGLQAQAETRDRSSPSPPSPAKACRTSSTPSPPPLRRGKDRTHHRGPLQRWPPPRMAPCRRCGGGGTRHRYRLRRGRSLDRAQEKALPRLGLSAPSSSFSVCKYPAGVGGAKPRSALNTPRHGPP